MVFVEGKGRREVGSRGGNGLSVQERDIPRYKTRNTMVMVLSKITIVQNDLFPFGLLNIAFHHGQH